MPLGPSTPVRVVRIITRLNIGGPSIQAAELSSQLSSRGFETMLVHGTVDSQEGDMYYLLERGGRHPRSVQVAALSRALAPGADTKAFRDIYRLIAEFKPAIVHTHMAKAGAVGRLATLIYNRTSGRHAPAEQLAGIPQHNPSPPEAAARDRSAYDVGTHRAGVSLRAHRCE